MTDLKDREKVMKKDKEPFPSPQPIEYSHFRNGNSYTLVRQRMSDKNRCAEEREGLREGVSPLILLYLIVAIALQYSYNTHKNVNACNHNYAHPQ